MFKIKSGKKPDAKKTAALCIAAAFVFFFFGCAGSASSKNDSPLVRSGSKPAWVDNPDLGFPGQRYLAQVGYGENRTQAEQNALASLAAIFGRSVQSETSSFYSYAQAIKNGSIEFEENKSMESEVITSVEMDSLLGAEISEIWFDGAGACYAAAIMEKSRVIPLYTDLFKANERLISGLTTLTQAEKNTLYGYSRYLLAAAVADVNRVYANALAVLGAQAASRQTAGGDEYRLQALEIAKTIPIAVEISGDTANRRLENAFSRALNSLGFLSGGINSRYVLEGDFAITSTLTDTQGNVHLRYSLTAGLRDNSGSVLILPFNATGREGHLNESSAQDLVMRTLETKITGEFAGNLLNYLSASLPGLR